MPRKLIWLALTVFVGLGSCHATEKEKSPGLDVGAVAPNFKLTDQFGKQRELRAMLKDGPVAIVFHRSAQW